MGFFIAYPFCLLFFAILFSDETKSFKECQKSLPRDQECIIVALPE
jgi:hypothetical protein